MEQLFEALSATSLKADLAVEKEQMTISLKLPKDCKEAVWIQEIAALQPHCDKKNTNIRKERIPFKRRPRRWHKRNATNDARCRCVNHCFLHCKSVECVLSRSFQNFVGDEGFYVYQQVYPIYGIAMTLALSGLPQFISKIVAEQPDIRSQKQVLRQLYPYVLWLAIACWAFFFGSQEIAISMGMLHSNH